MLLSSSQNWKMVVPSFKVSGNIYGNLVLIIKDEANISIFNGLLAKVLYVHWTSKAKKQKKQSVFVFSCQKNYFHFVTHVYNLAKIAQIVNSCKNIMFDSIKGEHTHCHPGVTYTVLFLINAPGGVAFFKQGVFISIKFWKRKSL